MNFKTKTVLLKIKQGFLKWSSKSVKQIISDLSLVTLSVTVFLLNVRLSTESSLREQKEYKIVQIEKKYDSLFYSSRLLEVVNKKLTTDQISRAGITEQIGLIIWIKELNKDEWTIIYVSPEYNQLLPENIDRISLFGRTGKFYDDDFGKIWQRNDSISWHGTKLFTEPFRWNGKGKVLVGEFRKGRVPTSANKRWVFGEFIKEIKGERADSLINHWVRTNQIDTTLLK